MAARPYIVQQHVETQRSLLLRSSLSRELINQVGYLVSLVNGDRHWVDDWAAAVLDTGRATEPVRGLATGDLAAWRGSMRERDALLVAHQVTTSAPDTTDDQIDTLRAHGMSDREILELVLVTAGFNAANRLDIALCPALDASLAPSGRTVSVSSA
jgi:alkylhydroperoxidase family enzyme